MAKEGETNKRTILGRKLYEKGIHYKNKLNNERKSQKLRTVDRKAEKGKVREIEALADCVNITHQWL